MSRPGNSPSKRQSKIKCRASVLVEVLTIRYLIINARYMCGVGYCYLVQILSRLLPLYTFLHFHSSLQDFARAFARRISMPVLDTVGLILEIFKIRLMRRERIFE